LPRWIKRDMVCSMPQQSIGTPTLWIGFSVLVLVMLALDLGVFHRKAHEVSTREAIVWSIVWVALAGVFGAAIWAWSGQDRALEFYTGYVVEKALSVDNLFVFLAVFAAFKVPAAYQHRVLFWGILGALVTRALFIGAGAALLARFHFVMYVFGIFLLITAVKLLVHRGDADVKPEKNILLRIFRRLVPSVGEFHGPKFMVKQDGKRRATPLLAVLVTIEGTDVVFAVDSIPAIFAVTTDPFIVYTSNIFAILGLRSLYFALANMLERFHYLGVGLALVLGFVGVKMLLADVYPIPILASLGVISAVLAVSVVASMMRPLPAKTPRHSTETP
jgi:TerC family integral membrane protein